MERNCNQCGQLTKNKKYCSVKCQHKGYKKFISKRIKIKCLNCNKEFCDTEYKINTLGKKYCSRKCKDIHQKEKYLGSGNPTFGRKSTEKEKKHRSEMIKKMWKTDEFKNKVKEGQQKFKKENGYWPGTDVNSKNKRKKTFLDKYQVDHNWKNKKIREKCDETTFKLYGKKSLEIAREKLFKNSETSIEKIIKKILNKNKIKFKKNFHIFFNDKECKIYDFYIPSCNLLIEADGDYWHGNTEIFKTLNEIQIINKKNDVFKNDLAKQEGYCLVRFWENKINSNNFEEEFLNVIKFYDNKK